MVLQTVAHMHYKSCQPVDGSTWQHTSTPCCVLNLDPPEKKMAAKMAAWRFLSTCLWLCLVISQISAYCEIPQTSNMGMGMFNMGICSTYPV